MVTEQIHADGTVTDGLGNFVGIDQPAAASKIAKAAEGTARKYEKELDAAQALVAEAETAEAASYEAIENYWARDPHGADEDELRRLTASCFRAYDLRESRKHHLARLAHPSVLSRRLEDSAKLARLAAEKAAS